MIILINNVISLNKFNEGGAAILAAVNKNQKNVILGSIINNPLLIIIARDPDIL